MMDCSSDLREETIFDPLKTFFSSGSCVPKDVLSLVASFFTMIDSTKMSPFPRQCLTPLLIFLRCSLSMNQTFVRWLNHALERHKGLLRLKEAVFYLASACHVSSYLCRNLRLHKPILPAPVSVSSRNVFMNIPTHIIQDILVRLTPFEIGRCRCVCKDWLHLLSQDEFLNLHSQTGLIVHSVSSTTRGLPFGLFGHVEIKDEPNHHLVRYKAGMERLIPDRNVPSWLIVVGSVNGLLCVDQGKSICVWNPTIGESITIQSRGKDHCYDVLTYGFGISSSCKYKVVRIWQEIKDTRREEIGDSTCLVYTLGRGGGFWKKIDDPPSFHSTCPQLGGLFLNGKLHWLVYDKNKTQQICCFDLESESFEPFPPPPKLPRHQILRQIYFVTLNLYKGCISVCTCDDNCPSKFDIVIWVMKEYGVEKSWTKEVVISKFLRDGIDSPKLDKGIEYYNEAVYIIRVFEDGEILLLRKRGKILFSYQPKTKTVKYYDLQEALLGSKFPFISTPTHYVSSMVSPKNLLQLGDVTEPRPASRCVVL